MSRLCRITVFYDVKSKLKMSSMCLESKAPIKIDAFFVRKF